jgi:hypothetical protein
MIARPPTEISRRRFLVAGGFTVAAACLIPRGLFAQADELVPGAMKQSATAKITVQILRRNVSVLLGPGGNIAVLTGPMGSLLWTPKLSLRARMFQQLLRASMRTQSNN